MINRQLHNPIFGHGYARLEDGRMVIFAAEGSEPTRIHPMQIWQTPFCSDDFAARQPVRSGFFGRIGNAELVRGVSDLLGLSHEIETPEVSVQRYTQLCQNPRRLFDVYHWLGDAQCQGMAAAAARDRRNWRTGARRVREGREHPSAVGPRDG